jgi:hypothetical protein
MLVLDPLLHRLKIVPVWHQNKALSLSVIVVQGADASGF